MEILVIGNEINFRECRAKFGETHRYLLAENYSQVKKLLTPESVVFDFQISEHLAQAQIYHDFSSTTFLDVSKISFQNIADSVKTKATCFGFCGLPTFLNREILEVSLSKETDRIKLEEACNKLNTKFAVVTDQIGLITPRIICMIINEAYFAIQENIASRADIDLAMKLGTNYPFGPFEWCEKIGIGNVYELLNAVYETTKDDRYKICELLREEATREKLGHLH